MWRRGKFSYVVLTLQIIFIVIFAICVNYSKDASAEYDRHSLSKNAGGSDPQENTLEVYYSMFQDVNVMIFVGFGFLMTFLKRYSYSAVALNLLYAALSIQWCLIVQGFWASEDGKTIHIEIESMIAAEFGSATVLITYGALLGKTSPLQMVVLSIIEIAIFASNEHLLLSIYKVVDIGGSISLHTFGAYFGLMMACVMNRETHHKHEKEGATYYSDVFAMIGTLFLWLFWPSFNAALSVGDDRHRAVINTFLSLTSSCLSSFAVSALMDRSNRLDMVHVQNATLAGGVAVGAIADLMIQPFGAMIIGGLAGIISTFGYCKLTPFLAQRFKLHDTCGVNNLHGMPGILSGLASALVASIATEEVYNYSLYEIYPARAPHYNTSKLNSIRERLYEVQPGDNRSSVTQALYQLLGLGTTILVALVGGAVTGAILKLPFFEPPPNEKLFDDSLNWELPEDVLKVVSKSHELPEVQKEEETSKF